MRARVVGVIGRVIVVRLKKDGSWESTVRGGDGKWRDTGDMWVTSAIEHADAMLAAYANTGRRAAS